VEAIRTAGVLSTLSGGWNIVRLREVAAWIVGIGLAAWIVGIGLMAVRVGFSGILK